MAAITLVLGASPDPSRYSHRAVLHLRAYGHEVIALGKREGTIGDVPIEKRIPPNSTVDTVTLYLSAAHQEVLRESINALHPRRVIFNPGAENPDFARQLKDAGIEALDACTLVMLSVGAY
ncbi:MAG TPA: CoA-binding protein [Flavobacteriales bacterium]|nr:CoA-binding protein [Flavobacteriales bacterium]